MIICYLIEHWQKSGRGLNYKLFEWTLVVVGELKLVQNLIVTKSERCIYDGLTEGIERRDM